jgi:hypothetical protein
MADEEQRTGLRGKEEVEHVLFSILTTDQDAMMQSIHPRSVSPRFRTSKRKSRKPMRGSFLN